MKGKRDKKVSPVRLGPLENKIMQLIWDRKEASVRDIYAALVKKREIAYTTVMTVMGKLAGKGMLHRDDSQRAYLYRPAVSRTDYMRTGVADTFETMLQKFGEPSLSTLVDHLNTESPEILDELETAIKRLRKNPHGNR